MTVCLPLHVPLAGFRLQSLVGQGASGIVYRAERVCDGLQVALKVLQPPPDVDPDDALARFDHEAKALAALRHPNIVGFVERGEMAWKGKRFHFLAMEYLEGLRSLDIAWEECEDIPWLLDRFEELLAGLEHMHSGPSPIVHRDLKPANLGIPLDGRLRILDLGLARLPASVLTLQGSTIGSLRYIAPEQVIDAGTVDPRADLYSAGVILLELIGGGHPLQGVPWGRALRIITQSDSLPPTPRAIPPEFEPLVGALTAKNPEARVRSAGEALALLRQLRGRPTSLNPATAGNGSTLKAISQHLEDALLGTGSAVLLIGQPGPQRKRLLEVVAGSGQAEAMRVLQVQGSQQLRELLGCESDALLPTLRDAARQRPTLICVDALQPEDGTMLHLVQQAAAGMEGLMIVAAAEKSLPASGAEVFSLS
ncbi:MAG: serine/threonine-protein kinase [Candidatus Xenobia bacterium]